MNYLLAKLKGINEEIKKVTSHEDDFMPLPNLEEPISYDPKYKLDTGEWYKLETADLNKYHSPFKTLIESKRLNTANYSQITVPEYEKIKYLCFTSRNYLLFQKITPSQILRKKWLYISGEPKFQSNQKIIIFNEYPDAIIDRGSKTLCFKDLGKIKDLFLGIEELYREATQKEVKTFINQDFLKLENGYTIKSIKTMNRKLIALITDKIERYSSDSKKKLVKYGKNYGFQFNNKNQFLIRSELELKNLIYLIDERYYKTTISEEKRLANSIKKIENS